MFCSFRKGFLGISLVSTIAGFLSAFAPNYISLLILRFFAGYGIGCAHMLASSFLEFVPIQNRGTWMTVFSASWTFATTIEAAIAWVCTCPKDISYESFMILIEFQIYSLKVMRTYIFYCFPVGLGI